MSAIWLEFSCDASAVCVGRQEGSDLGGEPVEHAVDLLVAVERRELELSGNVPAQQQLGAKRGVDRAFMPGPM